MTLAELSISGWMARTAQTNYPSTTQDMNSYDLDSKTLDGWGPDQRSGE
jgi:hypothetical protein